jgi:hypothetical protein
VGDRHVHPVGRRDGGGRRGTTGGPALAARRLEQHRLLIGPTAPGPPREPPMRALLLMSDSNTLPTGFDARICAITTTTLTSIDHPAGPCLLGVLDRVQSSWCTLERVCLLLSLSLQQQMLVLGQPCLARNSRTPLFAVSGLAPSSSGYLQVSRPLSPHTPPHGCPWFPVVFIRCAVHTISILISPILTRPSRKSNSGSLLRLHTPPRTQACAS